MPSFDIVSRTDRNELKNAMDGVMREIGTRYDFKGSKSSVELGDDAITVMADDDMKLKQVKELVITYMVRRKQDPKCLEWGKPEQASGNMLRVAVTIKEGIDKDAAKVITKMVKGMKAKVQASIQGDEVRITGKKRDDLQAVITEIKAAEFDRPVQFVNMRD